MLRAQKARSDATSTPPLFFSKNPKCGINDSESSWKPPHGQGHILTFMFPRRLVRSTTRSLLMRSLFGKRRQRNESHTCRDRDPRETSTPTAMKPTHRARVCTTVRLLTLFNISYHFRFSIIHPQTIEETLHCLHTGRELTGTEADDTFAQKKGPRR